MDSREAQEIVDTYCDMSMEQVAMIDRRHPEKHILEKVLQAMAVVGELVDNGDGTYSLPKEEDDSNT